MRPTGMIQPLALLAAVVLLVPASAQARAGAAPAPSPKIPYAFAAHPRFEEGDWQLVSPGGSHALSRATWGSFVVRGRVAIGAYATEGEPGYVVERAGARGHVSRVYAGNAGYGLVTSPDRTITAWLGADGTVATLGSDGDGGTLDAVPTGHEPAVLEAILGQGDCRMGEGAGGCIAYVGVPELAEVWLTNSDGMVRRVPHIAAVADAGPFGLVGPVPSMGEQQCDGLVDFDYREVWRTCGITLRWFSPGGGRVVGTAGRRVVVYDAQTGTRGAHWRLSGAVDDIVWEDRAHLLVTVHDADGWSLLRLGVRGSTVATVRGPFQVGTADYGPFNLPER